MTSVVTLASVWRSKHLLSRSGANSIHGADYLFKTIVGCREFSVHFIELDIIGYQASVNIYESRRFLHEKPFLQSNRAGT